MQENVFNKVRNFKPPVNKTSSKGSQDTALFYLAVCFFDEGKSDAAFPLPKRNRIASQAQKSGRGVDSMGVGEQVGYQSTCEGDL